MRTTLLAPALSGALLLAESEAAACGNYYESSRGCPTTYGSVGPLVSIAFGERGSVGFGAEFSVNHLPDNTNFVGYGGYFNAVGYVSRLNYARLNLGAQGNLGPLGAEAGVGFLSGSSGESDQPPAFGMAVGAFAEIPYLLMVAFRTTLPFEGPPQVALDIGTKFPFVLQGSGYYFPSGRPLRMSGAPIVADPRMVSEQAPDAQCVHTIGRELSAHMADRWLDDARLEHAAVHAFLSLARRLAALRAPGHLVRRALEAAAEEHRHTVACLDVVARYAGRKWRLPALPIPDELADVDVRELVRETWVDGCIGEGLAAEMARARADVCCPARGRAVLGTIAREERRHAELAFEILRFLLTLDGYPGEAACDEFACLLRHTDAPRYMHCHDSGSEAAEGRPDPRLGATFDHSITRGVALMTAAGRAGRSAAPATRVRLLPSPPFARPGGNPKTPGRVALR